METGTIINQYEIISSIGKGGMGEVFLAEDTKLDRKVALKILPAEFAEDKDRMSRFVREAKSASALNHPNIITIHEIGESDGTHFIATEFIEGETLTKHLKGENVSLKTVLDIATQIASALQTAHSAGIVHRDIKPDNVMIRADGLAKILDFGIAKLSEPPAVAGGLSEDDATAIKPQSTSPGMVIGTANYMSPEQAKGKEIDARSDIFSFGIVFYEMLTGKRAFEGETALESISSILKDEPKPISQFLPEVPKEIERIVNKTLKKDREERYQTSKDLLIDLKDAKQSLELQNLMERSIVPNQDANQTQILKATTLDEVNQTATNQTVVRNSKTKYLAAGLLTLLLAIGGFVGYKYLSPTTNQINSIAVMPFENKNSDADTEYLSDGLAESVIYRLSQIPDLKVSPTSSVFRYKGKETDPQVIAKELGVDSVMTGRITQRGDNLTISVNLVDTRNGKSLWGEQYERKMSDLLTTQREIASEITNKLQLKLSGAETKGITKKYTDSNEAYQFYLKGRYHFARRTKDDVLKAIEYYNQATKLDPNFALAYARIAEAYNQMPNYPYLSPNEAIPQAKTAARRALEIDPTLAEAHAALANSLTAYDWNWTEAESEFKRALELDPNNALAHYRYGTEYLMAVGRNDEALVAVKRALEIEPLDINMVSNVARVHLYGKRFDKALEQARKANEFDSNFIVGRFILGMAYNQNGLHEDALRVSESTLQNDPTNQFMLQVAGIANAKLSRRQETEKVISKFREIEKSQYIVSYFIASIYVALGEQDKAFVELNKAFEKRDTWLRWVKVDPHVDSLRDDPRHKDLLRRMGFPE